MLRAKSYDQVADITGERRARTEPAPAPATAPAAPATSPAIEQALATMAQHIQHVASIAAQASIDAAAAARRPDCTMEADIVRDNEGRMTRVVIRRTHNNYEG